MRIFGRATDAAFRTLEIMKSMELNQKIALCSPEKVMIYKLIEIGDPKVSRGHKLKSVIYDEEITIKSEDTNGT